MSVEERAKQDELAAMSARLADIQAQMMRLDALGAHVAEKAKVKGDEFDFSKLPPMGGPEEAIRIEVDPVALDRKLSLLNEELSYRELKLKALDRFLQNQRQAVVDLDNMPVRNGYITSRLVIVVTPLHVVHLSMAESILPVQMELIFSPLLMVL